MLSLELILLFLSFGPIEHENMKTRSDLTFARRAIKLKFYVHTSHSFGFIKMAVRSLRPQTGHDTPPPPSKWFTLCPSLQVNM